MPSHLHVPGCARLNIMRLNAARLNYYEPVVLGSVGGVDQSKNLRIEGASVQHVLNEQPDTAAVSAHGFTPVAGQTLAIYNGDRALDHQLFGGRLIETTVRYEQKPGNVAWDLRGIDPTWLLNRRRALATYTGLSASAIVLDLMTLARGITTNNVAPNLPVIDEISFVNETLATCLTAVCERIGGYWYQDYADDLHVFLNEATAANPITDANGHGSSDHSLTEDLSQVVTKVIARGASVGAAVDVAAGAAELPVDLGDQQNFYNVSGGLAEAGAQRITYTGVRGLGAVGALVGAGNAPSTAPIVTQAGPGGSTSALIVGGVYKYAVSFVTASGETLPGPIGTGAPSGAMPPNPVQITARDGTYGPSGLDPNQPVVGGTYRLRITFNFDVMSYGIGPASVPVIYNGKYWQLYFGTTAITPEGIVYFPELHPGFVPPTGRYQQIWIDRTVNGGSTFYGAGFFNMPTAAGVQAGPGGWFQMTTLWSDADTIGGAGGIRPGAAGPPFSALYLSQIPKSTLPAVTSRKLYRTATNGTQLKLLAALNTSDTAYLDIKADATLGANAPNADTSAIPSDTAQQVVAGSPTLPVSATGPFENDGGAGWARVGNMVVSYTGIGTGLLTGLPASGPGALSATVRYGAQVLVQPRLVGVAGVVRALRKGAPVTIRLEVENVAAQDAFAARLGPPATRADGVIEEPYTNGQMTLLELQDYADALLADRKDPRRTWRFFTRDPSCQVGRLITVALTKPPISGTFRIQRMTFSEIAITGGLARLPPKVQVEATNKLFTFADLLRRIRGREGGAQ